VQLTLLRPWRRKHPHGGRDVLNVNCAVCSAHEIGSLRLACRVTSTDNGMRCSLRAVGWRSRRYELIKLNEFVIYKGLNTSTGVL